jgi:hypothetical protein
MTRKLEELFDLPQDTPSPEPVKPVAPEISIETANSIDKIEAALPQVRGLDATDGEMDELATEAMKSYQDLMDLGMNVDSRYASEILSVASNMLGHAITAKTAKLNKKLKMVDLQLKKMSLDQRTASVAPVLPQEGTGHVLDRNELISRLLGAKDKEPKKE